MRSLLLLIALLGPEQQTPPHLHEPPAVEMAAPAVALARDAHGVAMAWSMPNAAGVSRIHVARLDRFGRMGAVRELPVHFGGTRTAALHPSMAPRTGDGGFLVTWIEEPGNRVQAAYSLLDAALVPAQPVLLPGVELTTPPLAHSGDAMWIANGANLWEIEPDGFARGLLDATASGSDLTATAAGPQVISASTIFRCDPSCFPLPWGGGCRCARWVYTMRLVSREGVIESGDFDFQSDAKPAIESDGDKLIVAWLRGAQSSGGHVMLSSVDPAVRRPFPAAGSATRLIGHFGADSGKTRPDIAVTSQGTYVVWRTTTPGKGHDIVGAFVARDGSIEPFTIADSAADERDPSILALENGGVLVAYRKIEGKQSRIARRTMGNAGGRRRAVR